MTLGLVSVGLGILGIFLPILPTTVFLRLAAFAFSRSSATLHNWLLGHPQLGPPILSWMQHGAITRRSKLAAVGVMALSLVVGLALRLSVPVLLLQAFVITCVAVFILTRPVPPD
jgi:uncharacterized protein